MGGDSPSPNARVEVSFRDLTGAVETGLAACAGGAQDRAAWLLETMAAQVVRGGAGVAVGALTLAEFDGCLADLFDRLYGGQLPCESACPACGERFEFELSLAEFRARAAAESAGARVADGVVKAPSGRLIRLPCVADLGLLPAVGREAWMRSLLLDGPFDADAMEAEIAAAAPVLSQDLTAPCPACGTAHTVRFDMARFLVDTLDGEAAFLWREVHLVARTYAWGLADILSLPRGVRRQLAGLIVAEAQPRLRAAS